MSNHLRIETLDWQDRILEDLSSKVIAASGGLGSSKTHGAALKHLDLCFRNYDSELSAFTEPIYSKISDTAFPKFRQVLHSYEFEEGRDFQVIGGQPRPLIRLHQTGQEIHFLTASKPEMIIGAEYSHGAMDEAGDSPVAAFRNMRARIRCPKAIVKQLCVYGAPQGITWFADEFDSETQEGWEQESTRNWIKPERGYRRIRLITDENTYLPDDYIDILMDTYGHNKNLIRAYRYGIFCPLYEGNAFKDFEEDRHVKSVEADPYRDLYLTFDFNALPLVWLTMQIKPYETLYGLENKYCFLNESTDKNELLSDALADFIRKYPPSIWADTRILIYGDRSGHAKSHKIKGSDYDYIRTELGKYYSNVEIRASRKVAPEIGSVEATNKAFSYDRALIDPKCTGYIRGLQAMRWKDGERKLHKPAGETISHKPDAGKYLIYQLDVMDSLQDTKKIYGLRI